MFTPILTCPEWHCQEALLYAVNRVGGSAKGEVAAVWQVELEAPRTLHL
jgi:hypothetical protein